MPRPRKSRRVCHFPQHLQFGPQKVSEEAEPVQMTVDEYETIRLIDLERLSQEDCGEWMGIARTTVQLIYTSARKKLAQMLVEGRPLQISGGDYRLCDGGDHCGKKPCYRQHNTDRKELTDKNRRMRIAVPYEAGNIFPDFKEARQFMIYDVLDETIHASETVAVKGTGYGAQLGILTAMRVDALICGKIDLDTSIALTTAGIQFYAGITGAADAAAKNVICGNELRF